MSTISYGRRTTYVWIFLSAITLISWWLGPAHAGGHAVASTAISIAVLAIALIKARLIIRYFMEVRIAPLWLRLFTDAWLIVFWGTILAVYLY
jgi:Prokaryotic Cytochrome C oxidase subunit IV